MTAEIIDLATRRAERDAALREDHEVDTYGIVQRCPGEGFELYAEMKSGKRIMLAEGLTFVDATISCGNALGRSLAHMKTAQEVVRSM